MSCDVDFIVVHQEGDLLPFLRESLREAYEGSYDEAPEGDGLDALLKIRYQKKCWPYRKWQQRVRSSEIESVALGEMGGWLNFENEHPETKREFTITGITVSFEESEHLRVVIRDFANALLQADDSFIFHVVKFHDPELFARQQSYAIKIAQAEQRIREALSIALIDNFDGNFYHLLKDLNVSITGKDKPKEEQLRAVYENELFHLLFSQYPRLNESPQPKPQDLVDLIQSSYSFEDLKNQLSSPPILSETYQDLIASLSELLGPLESVRNCIAHNRELPRNQRDAYSDSEENFQQAIHILHSKLDDFMKKLSQEEEPKDLFDVMWHLGRRM